MDPEKARSSEWRPYLTPYERHRTNGDEVIQSGDDVNSLLTFALQFNPSLGKTQGEAENEANTFH